MICSCCPARPALLCLALPCPALLHAPSSAETGWKLSSNSLNWIPSLWLWLCFKKGFEFLSLYSVSENWRITRSDTQVPSSCTAVTADPGGKNGSRGESHLDTLRSGYDWLCPAMPCPTLPCPSLLHTPTSTEPDISLFTDPACSPITLNFQLHGPNHLSPVRFQCALMAEMLPTQCWKFSPNSRRLFTRRVQTSDTASSFAILLPDWPCTWKIFLPRPTRPRACAIHGQIVLWGPP